MVAMDSSVIILLVLFPDEKNYQIEEAQKKAAGFDGMLQKMDTI